MMNLFSNKSTSSFPAALDKVYKRNRSKRAVMHFRYALCAGIIISLGLGWLDIVADFNSVAELWRIRVSLLTLMIAVLVLTYSKVVSNFYDFIVATVCVATTVGYSGLALLTPEPIKWVYYFSVTLFIFWWPTVSRLSVRWGLGLLVVNLLLNNFIWIQFDNLASMTVTYFNLIQILLISGVFPILYHQESRDREAFLIYHKQNLMKFQRNELEESESRLRFLVVLDSLTGLANRRSFERAVKLEWNRSGRSRRPVGMLRLDVDQIKELKDKGGVEAVESVTMQIADTIRSYSRRSGDLAAHYHNGCFALMLADTDLNACYQVANRINEDLKDLEIKYSNESDKRLTISIGVTAMVPRPQFIYEEILNTAEEALRRAQALGYEQIICL